MRRGAISIQGSPLRTAGRWWVLAALAGVSVELGASSLWAQDSPEDSQLAEGSVSRTTAAGPEDSESSEPSSSAPASSKSPGSTASTRLHGLLFGAKAVTGHQSTELGFGGGALAALEWGPSRVWGVQAELGFVALGSGREDPPEGLAELSGATGGHLAAGIRARPFSESSVSGSLGGLWLSGAVGASVTGGQIAPVLDAFLGFDFAATEQLRFGPHAGYLLVLQTEKDVPRPDNAHLVLAGLSGSFDFGPAEPRVRDRDFDGIVDERDQCPDDAEDKDGFEDEDGCPDPDNDQDGIDDVLDRCPLDPEDLDEFEDENGCPDPDNDRDDVLDVDDQCPLDPEDHDGFEDEDGCPDPDNDQDNIPDVKDLCPDEPEIVNGIADNDGCPDAESVRVVGDKIELDQKIHFWTNSHVIRGMSYPVIDKLARFLLEHPEYVHVDIEGHADQRGSEEFNVDLSERRAASIRQFLEKRGLDPSRLTSRGFGSSRPLVEANNERAWFMNRRVEFIVTRNRTVRSVDPGGPAFGRDKADAELAEIPSEGESPADGEPPPAGEPDDASSDTEQSTEMESGAGTP